MTKLALRCLEQHQGLSVRLVGGCGRS
jgi:hypothetical protein